MFLLIFRLLLLLVFDVIVNVASVSIIGGAVVYWYCVGSVTGSVWCHC